MFGLGVLYDRNGDSAKGKALLERALTLRSGYGDPHYQLGRIYQREGNQAKALAELEDAGDIELKPSGLRHRFRLLPAGRVRRPEAVATWLHGVFKARESADLKRLDAIVAFATDPGCSTRRLLAYFGEKMAEPCGHCGNCLAGRKPRRRLPRSPEVSITVDHLAAIQALRREGYAALRGSRPLARFLCGISSPATTRDRLTRHDAFGLLEEVPFLKVLEQIEA